MLDNKTEKCKGYETKNSVDGHDLFLAFLAIYQK